jgi:hypothetical protein
MDNKFTASINKFIFHPGIFLIVLSLKIILTTKNFHEKLEDLFAYCKEYFTTADTQVLMNQLNNIKKETNESIL